MDQKAIGQYIKACRKKKGLTQKELAERLSISFQAVSKWETGETLPDTSLLLTLCDLLDTSVDKLLNGGVFLRKEQRYIPMERIVEGFACIEKVKDCFGAESEFYRGIVKGINETMNFDFEDALAHRREVLYAEVLIRFLLEGCKADLEEAAQFIHSPQLLSQIARRM